MVRHSKKRRPQRGVLLIVVLSILVLFALISVTFVMVATQYHQGAIHFARMEQTGDDPAQELEPAIYQILRGPTNANSALLGHSLLEDLYGTQWVMGRVSATSNIAARGQFVTIPFAAEPGPAFSALPGFYNGCVLTMLEGPARGHSTRIVDYQPGTTLHVESFRSDLAGSVLPSTGNRFLINGRPFTGLGFGYKFRPADRLNSNLDAAYDGMPVALQPHFAMYATGLAVNAGGANEPYDAADYQNMLLALVRRHDASSVGVDVLPSLHRPALVNYWINHNSGNWTNADLRSRVVLRPMPWDHPNFSGSNPAFSPALSLTAWNNALVNGPWDVDNDGDGTPDSIWVDLGSPVKTAPDGRRYKALHAILCQDMGGRININAAGNVTQLHADYANAMVAPPGLVFSGGADSLSGRSRGQGYGTADISMAPVILANDHEKVLYGRWGTNSNVLLNRPGLDNADDLFSRYKSIGMPSNYRAQLSAYGSPPDLWGRGCLALDPAGQPLTYYMGLSTSNVDDPYEMDHFGTGSAADMPYTLAEGERLLRYHDTDAGTLPDRLLKLAPTSFASGRRRSLVTTDSRSIPMPAVVAYKGLRDSPYLTNGRAHSIMELMRAKLRGAGVSEANIPIQLKMMLPYEILFGGKMDINRVFGNLKDDNGNGVVDEPSEALTTEALWTDDGVGMFANVPMNHTNDDPLISNASLARQIYARHLYCLMWLITDNAYLHPTQESAGNVAKREFRARRIAQWAINVVDFRDPDSIMTPFEYDSNPYDGWAVDGNLASSSTDNSHGQRRVVWGCEYPDLLLTEAVAFHDRRVKDTKFDNSSDTTNEDDSPQERTHEGTDPDKKGDKDLDQYRIPQGSVFFEVYCTRNRQTANPSYPGHSVPELDGNNPFYPGDLYTLDSDNNYKLDLGRLSPAGSSGIQHPVWRIVITQKSDEGASLLEWTNANSDSVNFQPESDPSTAPKGDPAGMAMLRYAQWPTKLNPIKIERVVWFAPRDPTGSPEAPQVYYNRNWPVGSLVGLRPGGYAVIGPRTRTVIGAKTPTDPLVPEPSPQAIDLSNRSVSITNATGASTLPSAIRTPISIVAAAPLPAGWTSPAPEEGIGISVSEPLPQSVDYYPEPTSFPGGVSLHDGYYDDPETPANTFLDEPLDSEAGRPLTEDAMLEQGTYIDYKSALLQRLANPLLPWDSALNPYVTVDWSPIDLTVFNGEDRESAGWDNPGPWDPDDPDPTGDPNEKFSTRQRGTGSAGGNLWSQSTTTPPVTTATAPTDLYFRHELKHTLGYLNTTLGTPRAAPPAYVGDPQDGQQPFSWITWNNRPYVSHLELMLVPSSTPQRLLHDFSFATSDDPYKSTPNTHSLFRAPYRHLLNFFHSSNNPNKAANFYRLFDLVEVPSRFVGAERWYNPGHFADPGDPTTTGRRPPFNKTSMMRDPGKVNINTITDVHSDPRVWRSVSQGFPPHDSAAFWQKVAASRRGYGAATQDMFSLNASYPTRFANPFRDGSSGDLAPIALLRTEGVDATLLRRYPLTSNVPLFAYNSNQSYENTQRNPYFRYQGIQRLGNLLTTQSNVYAVWITVGYFEVEPTTIGRVHPDGVRLGRELNSDTGEVKRHRAFYLVDRSIPVAFQPGQTHNVGRAILVRRFIE